MILDDDDDDDEVLELKERLAAYNLESSPDRPAGTCLHNFTDYHIWTIAFSAFDDNLRIHCSSHEQHCDMVYVGKPENRTCKCAFEQLTSFMVFFPSIFL